VPSSRQRYCRDALRVASGDVVRATSASCCLHPYFFGHPCFPNAIAHSYGIGFSGFIRRRPFDRPTYLLGIELKPVAYVSIDAHEAAFAVDLLRIVHKATAKTAISGIAMAFCSFCRT
jgi:hypothetical protein